MFLTTQAGVARRMLYATSLGVSFITSYFCPHRQSAPQSAFNLCGCFNKTCIQIILVAASHRRRGWHPWEHLGHMKLAFLLIGAINSPTLVISTENYVRDLRKLGSRRKLFCLGCRGPWAANLRCNFSGVVVQFVNKWTEEEAKHSTAFSNFIIFLWPAESLAMCFAFTE